jgi:hypothetical protein
MECGSSLALATSQWPLSLRLSQCSYRCGAFYREKWWERRLDAYTRVIEALHHMVRGLDLDWRHEVEKSNYNEAYRKTLSEKAQAGWAEKGDRYGRIAVVRRGVG